MFLCQCTKTRIFTQKKETFSKDLCLHLRFVFKHWQRMKTKTTKNVFRSSEDAFKRYLRKLFALFKTSRGEERNKTFLNYTPLLAG